MRARASVAKDKQSEQDVRDVSTRTGTHERAAPRAAREGLTLLIFSILLPPRALSLTPGLSHPPGLSEL